MTGQRPSLSGSGPVEVRPVPGYAATKVYRCPWCEQEIEPGRPHVVAWPDGRPDERRHWHGACWRRHGAPRGEHGAPGGERGGGERGGGERGGGGDPRVGSGDV